MPTQTLILKQAVVVLASALLAACGQPNIAALQGPLTTNSLGADLLGGLPSSEAAHASVEAASPEAFVLTTAAAPFLDALARVVEPMRQTLASRLLADAVVSRGLASWNTAGASGQLTTLRRIAALEGEVMGTQVPTIVQSLDAPTTAGMMAVYQPETTGLGTITLYADSIAKGGKDLAVATLVHEMRHAAQYQLVLANQANASALGADQRTLANTYASAWQTMDAWGGESKLSYGDYVHLAVEYDAFQTGNEVAAIVSRGTYSAQGSGFVTVQYRADATVALDLTTLIGKYNGAALVGAVNAAEAKAIQAGSGNARQGNNNPFQQSQQQRHGGFRMRGG
jgi:hypothetical protein